MTNSFQMYYIMDSKYDLIFAVEATTAEEARAKADLELLEDNILYRCKFMQLN